MRPATADAPHPGDHLLFALDDTPTPRYGPCVQGAGVHHNPSPGPAGEKYVYGHVWVTLAWLARHPWWDTLSLPLRALLYVRAKDVPALAKDYPWEFRTKLELAVVLVRWLTVWLVPTDKALWLTADGAYAKRPFLRPVLAMGLVVFSRLRRDADLRGLPTTQRRRGQRGPWPTYGKDKIDLAKRAGQKRGWRQVQCVQYGKRVTKTIKTFEATWRPAGGRLRVVIVRERDGWLPYFCTDPAVAAETILEVMADRGAIEQTFKDVKEVWGAGQQQVRNVYASIGAWAVNLTMYSVVEAWAWGAGRKAWWTAAGRRGMRRNGGRRTPINARRCNARSSEKKSKRLCRRGGNGRSFRTWSSSCSIWQPDSWVFTESTEKKEENMSNESNTSKKRPDFIAYAVRPQAENVGPRYTRIGVAFNLRNGGVSVLYDATPLSGQIVLLDIGSDAKPTAISYGSPVRKPSFEVSMVRDGAGDTSYWTEVGSAWRQDGYVSIQLEVVPTSGKIILTQPKERE